MCVQHSLDMKQKVHLAILCCFCACIVFAQNGWQQLTTNTNLNLLDVHAYTSDTIFIAGDDGILLKSFNGGATFTTYQNSGNQIYTATFFQTADIGFVANGNGDVKRTTDGGQSFSTVSSCTCFISNILFSDPIHGLYAGAFETYRSTNAGLNFVNISPLIKTNRLASPVDSVFVSYHQKTIRRSGNFGQSFTIDTIHTATNSSLVNVFFTSTLHAYTMTSDGHFYETNDQGFNWSLVNTAAANLVVSHFVFLDSLRGFLIAGNFKDQIYKTTDGGQSWTLDFTAPESILDIAVYGHVVYAVGDNGYVVKNDFFTAVTEPRNTIKINIFPNPATTAAHLLVSENEIGQTVWLTDLTGRIVKTMPLTSTETTIDLSECAAGVYMLRLGNAVQQFIKL